MAPDAAPTRNPKLVPARWEPQVSAAGNTSTPAPKASKLLGMTDIELNWQERYASKVKTVQQAIRMIPAGQRILIGSGAAEPNELVSGMVEHGTHLADNDIVHLMTLGPAPYVQPGTEGRFRHTAFFIGSNVREAVHEGRADFMPVFPPRFRV